MPMSYSVVFANRQRFGDTNRDRVETSLDKDAPFVGAFEEYRFLCPEASWREPALLSFQCQGVNSSSAKMEINGLAVPGAIAPSYDVTGQKLHETPNANRTYAEVRAVWHSYMIVLPVRMIGQSNLLRISIFESGMTDDFVVSDVVVFYKTEAPILDPNNPVLDPG
jgi:hypothetical protein